MTIHEMEFDRRGYYCEISHEPVYDACGYGAYRVVTQFKSYSTDPYDDIRGKCICVTIFNGNTGRVIAEYTPGDRCEIFTDDDIFNTRRTIARIASELQKRNDIPRPHTLVYKTDYYNTLLF